MSNFALNWDQVVWQLPLEEPPIIAQMGVSVHGRAEGRSSDEYRLPNLWCLHFYRYEATLKLDGQAFPIHPGSVSVIPPNTQMVYRYRGLSEHCYCHFHLRPGCKTTPIRAVQDLGPRALPTDERLRDAAHHPDDADSRRQAVVWEILWSLTRDQNAATTPNLHHPTVGKALRIIEQRLSEPISIADLAQEVGVSYGYLSRLFQAELGETVVAYIRHRRSDRAEHLLRSSTMAIKSVAAAVGVPDLHQFNRMMHRTQGVSPRSIRFSQEPHSLL